MNIIRKCRICDLKSSIIVEESKGLSPSAAAFIPIATDVDIRYSLVKLSELKPHKKFLKGKTVRILDGEHTNEFALFQRFNGTVGWARLEGTEKDIALSCNRLVQVTRK
jgi:hypothetical protein